MTTIDYRVIEITRRVVMLRVTANDQSQADAKATVGSLNCRLEKEGVEKIGDMLVESYRVEERSTLREVSSSENTVHCEGVI